MEYYLLTFDNTQGAIGTERVLLAEKIKAVMMPTPTYITKSCGLSLKVEKEEVEKIRDLLKNNKINIKKIYIKRSGNFEEMEFN